MKLFKKIQLWMMIPLLIGVIASCREDDELFPVSNPQNLSELAAENGSLSTLNDALNRVGLDSVLSSTRNFTVFAPENAAFEGIDLTNIQDDDLTNILLNHVRFTTTAEFTSTLTTGYTTTMAIGPDDNNISLFTNIDGESISINGGNNVNGDAKDIGATNGVIHVVDGVLLPPTVTDHALANPDFSSLAAALSQADLADVLDGTGTFTVFAPTNAAFEKFLMEVNGAFGWANLTDIPQDVLEEVLLFHVISDNNIVSGDILETTQTTIQGESLQVSATATIADATPDATNIILTDVQGINGIVHAIDKVLIPEDVYQDILSNTLNAVERLTDKNFTSLAAVAEKLGMVDQLSTDELTIFAPSNDAFEALFALSENFASLDDFDTAEELDALRALVEYHLVDGLVLASNLMDGGSINTVNGDAITVDLSGDEPRLIPSLEGVFPSIIESTNIGSTNAVIHQINRVLIPTDLATALGIDTGGGDGLQEVKDPNLVFFDWNGKDPWWGNVAVENQASLSVDGTSYGRANFQTGGTGWQDLFWRNSSTLNGGDVVATNIDDYVLKFDINVMEPISAGKFVIRFNNSGGEDAFYDWAPWNDTGEAFDTDGWITIEIPLSVIGQSDFSMVDNEFGMAFSDADVFLNFAIDNVRFDTPGDGGPDPVVDEGLVFFDWNGKDPFWGNVVVENDAAISVDGTSYGRADFQTGGTGWQDLFWRNDGSLFGGNTVGTDLSNYVLKFDINVMEPIDAGRFILRFNDSNGVDSFYDWAPWNDSGEAFSTDGWTTISIPVSVLNQPDFNMIDNEFGMAFQDADVLLNFAIDNVRFEEN